MDAALLGKSGCKAIAITAIQPCVRKTLSGGVMAQILVVDDSDLVRRGMKQLLGQHEGWEICGEAGDGQEAVSKARELAPDVVVLDFAMPNMNGIEAAQKIHNELPRTAIVLCSMYLDRQLASLAQNVGITSVLSKSNVGQVVQGVEARLRGESFDKPVI
jgi:DNA-binding NarL/FixJ family response regulator